MGEQTMVPRCRIGHEHTVTYLGLGALTAEVKPLLLRDLNYEDK
jgi:hypothetical protein